MQTLVVLVQPLQLKLPTGASQFASSTITDDTAGGSVCDVRAIVHFGGGGSDCQATVTVAGALRPAALLAKTVYATWPTAGDVATQVLVVLAQLVHVNDVGALLQLAVNVTLPPTKALVGDALAWQTGTPAGGGNDEVGEHIATGYGAGP
ncbi:MAG TPA: hypothetical protein VFM89_06135 [Casimicrobiaceae bacterium]|nr:hypothetical protein [Casimicrobiaceae bacterium]